MEIIAFFAEGNGDHDDDDVRDYESVAQIYLDRYNMQLLEDDFNWLLSFYLED